MVSLVFARDDRVHVQVVVDAGDKKTDVEICLFLEKIDLCRSQR